MFTSTKDAAQGWFKDHIPVEKMQNGLSYITPDVVEDRIKGNETF